MKRWKLYLKVDLHARKKKGGQFLLLVYIAWILKSSQLRLQSQWFSWVKAFKVWVPPNEMFLFAKQIPAQIIPYKCPHSVGCSSLTFERWSEEVTEVKEPMLATTPDLPVAQPDCLLGNLQYQHEAGEIPLCNPDSFQQEEGNYISLSTNALAWALRHEAFDSDLKERAIGLKKRHQPSVSSARANFEHWCCLLSSSTHAEQKKNKSETTFAVFAFKRKLI